MKSLRHPATKWNGWTRLIFKQVLKLTSEEELWVDYYNVTWTIQGCCYGYGWLLNVAVLLPCRLFAASHLASGTLNIKNITATNTTTLRLSDPYIKQSGMVCLLLPTHNNFRITNIYEVRSRTNGNFCFSQKAFISSSMFIIPFKAVPLWYSRFMATPEEHLLK